MAKQKKKQKLVKDVDGKPAFYARYELNELRHELSGPWTIVYQTDCGAIAERPEPAQQRAERRMFLPGLLLTPEQAQAHLDRVWAEDAHKPRPGDYVAVVFDHTEVVNGFVVSVSECYAQVIMDDGSTGRWVPPEYRRRKKDKKVTRQCGIANMLVLARGADEKAA
jgi:hypothetical protein